MFDLVYKFFCRFQSETYEIIDALFVGEGKLTDWLDGTSTTITHLTLENGIVKWTVPASNQYLGYRNTSPSGLSSIKTVVKLTSSRNVRLSVYVNDGGWQSVNTTLINAGTSTPVTLTSNIPSGVSQLWVRLQSNSSSDKLDEGDIVYVNQFEVYPD